MLADLLFPKQCLRCSSWGHYLCAECAARLRPAPFQRCIGCHRPSMGGWTHPRCQTKYLPERLIGIFDYHDNAVSQIINISKQAMVNYIFLELTQVACSRLEFQNEKWREFVICPIPQTRSTARLRGFNQSEVIAKYISFKFGLAIDRVLWKHRNTKQQKSLNKSQRKTNLSNCFKIASPEHIPAKIILVDDICTTGSTFLEATKGLKRAKAMEVWCLALAQD